MPRGQDGSIIGDAVAPTTDVASGIWTLNEVHKYQTEGIFPLGIPLPYNCDFLVVGGGGSGGGSKGGGGGGGGFRTSYGGADLSGRDSAILACLSFTIGTQYVITVGDGGVRTADVGVSGGSSVISGSDITDVTSLGGGGGGGGGANSTGLNGGCGGGGGGATGGGAGTYSVAGTGHASGGYDGKRGHQTGHTSYGNGGGGGGAGINDAVDGWTGYTGGSAYGGDAGTGQISTIIATGSATTQGIGHVSTNLYFSGGGGGGSGTSPAATGGGEGGLGGGSKGTDGGPVTPVVLPNSGGGGGGYGNNGYGGAGCVILRMLSVDYAEATAVGHVATVVVDGADTIVTWKGDGTFTA